VAREPLRVDRRRRDDQLEVGPAGQQLLEVAEQEVDVEAALVRLVDDQCVVSAEHPVVLDLGQQDAVGHHLDRGVLGGPVGEPDLVADRGAQLDAQLRGDPLGDGTGGDPARLGVPDRAADAAAELEADLRQLGGLARAGLAGDHDDLVVPDRGQDVVLAGGDRQLGRVAHRGDRGPPLRRPGRGLLDVRGQRGRHAVAAHAVEPAPQPELVAQRQLGQPSTQLSEGRRHTEWSTIPAEAGFRASFSAGRHPFGRFRGAHAGR
jgi:hypothetical protein